MFQQWSDQKNCCEFLLHACYFLKPSLVLGRTPQFSPHDAVLAQYMLSLCVCPSVHPSVCSSQVLRKWLNIRSRPQLANHPWKGRGQVMWTIQILVGTNHIFGTDKVRVIKFCTQVGCIKLQHTDDKSALKWCGQDHVSHFYLYSASDTRVFAIVVSLSAHAGIVSKRLNVGSSKQYHMIAQGFLVLWCQQLLVDDPPAA